MELMELKEKALALKAENNNLKAKVRAKENEYAQIIRKNFAEIILPYMKEMNAFIKGVGCRFSDKSVYLIDNNALQVRLRLSFSGISIHYKEWKSYGFDSYIDFEDRYKKLTNANWISLADFFESVDSCNAFIRKLNESYACILSKAIESFETENPSLAETLKSLTEKVSKASCVEEKEDGNIEININGKLYVGTLKEV